jgi:hypothetical protein
MNELKKLFTTLSYEELKEIQFDTPLALTGASIDDVVDVTEKPKKEATPKPSKRQVENVDKSEELMSPEVMEHDVNVDEDEDVDNIKPVELKQV